MQLSEMFKINVKLIHFEFMFSINIFPFILLLLNAHKKLSEISKNKIFNKTFFKHVSLITLFREC